MHLSVEITREEEEEERERGKREACLREGSALEGGGCGAGGEGEGMLVSRYPPLGGGWEIAGKHRRGIGGQGSRDLFLLFPLLTDQQPPPPSPPHPSSGGESKLLTSTAHQPPPNPLKAYCTIFPFSFHTKKMGRQK